MKTQVLSASYQLAVITLACASAEVGATSGIRGSLIRNGPMNELTSELFHAKEIHRRLEEDNHEGDNDHNGEEEEAAEEEEAPEEEEAAEEEKEDQGWQEKEDMQYADEEGESTTTTYTSKRAQYEAQAVQLFETAPAEWNAGQWDLLFALFGTILVSCCVLSAFFAYCCIFREDDDVDFSKGGTRRRRHRDDETVMSDYTKDTSLLPSVTSRSRSRNFSPRSWVSGSSFVSKIKAKRDANGYSAPSSSNVASPDGTTFSSGGFAQVDAASISRKNSDVSQKSKA